MLSDRSIARLLGTSPAVRLAHDLIRVAVAAAALAYVVYAGTNLVVVSRFMVERLHMNDFGKFYYSARAFLDGTSMYGPTPATAIPIDVDETREFWNMNPPHFHLLILPLAGLAPVPAISVWALLNLAALVVAAALIAKEVEWRWTAGRLVWLATIVIATGLTGLVVVTGQLTFMLMLAVTLAWRADRRGRQVEAAWILGLTASVKPFLGIFGLYFLVRRAWPAAGAMALAGGGALAVGVAVFGWDEHRAWLGALSAVDWMWAPMNGSIGGVLSRSFGDSPYFVPLRYVPAIVNPVMIGLSLVIVAVAFAAIGRDRSTQAVDRDYLGVLLVAQLVSPLGWAYYLPMIAGPGIALFRTRHLRAAPLRDALVLAATPAVFLPPTLAFLLRDSPWGGPTVGSMYGWATASLWFAWRLDGRAAERTTYLITSSPNGLTRTSVLSSSLKSSSASARANRPDS